MKRDNNFIKFKNVVKKYLIGDKEFKALDGVDFGISKGEFVVILGPSGAGKSTLLNLLGGMDTVTSGKIIVDGNVISNYNDNALTKYRANNVGFIFQFYNILPTLTVMENVKLIGDTISWHIYGDKKYYESKVIGFYRDPQVQGLSATKEYIESLGISYKATSIYTDVNLKNVDNIDDVSVIQNIDELKDAISNMLSMMRKMIIIIIVFAILLGVVIIYNMSILSFSEKTYQFLDF